MSKKYDYYGNKTPKVKGEKTKNGMKPWVRTTLYVSMGIIFGAAITVPVSLMIVNKNKDVYVDKNYGEPITYRFDSTDPKTKINGNYNFEVIEYPTKLETSDKVGYIYFLGQVGIQHFIDRINSDLVYGPEIRNLKRIYINNTNMTTSGENGIYFPATNEIGINTDNLAKRLWECQTPVNGEDKDWYHTLYTESDSYKYRVELVFQTFFHEYGHHIAHSYMTSSFNNYTDDIFTTYSEGGREVRKRDNWNSHFINVFKNAMDYDKDTPLPLPENLHQTTAQAGVEGGLYSIGDVYDAEDLYRIANGQNRPDYSIANGVNVENKLIFADVDAINNRNTIFERVNPIDLDDLQYLYSVQELVTRKYLQIFYKQNAYTVELRNHGIPSGILENQIYYETPLVNNGAPARFLEDNIYDEGVIGEQPDKELYDELKKQMGIDKNISFIWGKNDSFVNNDMTLTNDNPRDGSNNNLIKMGGYVNNPSINAIGYLDDNGDFVKIDDVNILNYNFNKKASLNGEFWEGKGQQRHLDETIQNHYSWTTNNFLNVNLYSNNHELVFKDSNGATEPLRTTRASDVTGYATNYLSHLPSLFHQYQNRFEEQDITGTFYGASEENGKVYIRPIVRGGTK